MEHILSLSYGKDSLACLGAIEKLGWKLDRIIHAEIWATKNIPADLPPMVEFKAKADKIIKERYGITVEHVSAGVTYEDIFYRIVKPNGKSINAGHINGFPLVRGAWCNSRLKVAALNRIDKNAVSYIGIAADEPKRIARHKIKPNVIMPLVDIGWTEADCRKWCEDNDLLSPIYMTSMRGGCWFCHYQSIEQLRLLRHNYPDYWELLLKWDEDSPVSFTSKHTLLEYDLRFELEDSGLVPADKKFRWSMI